MPSIEEMMTVPDNMIPDLGDLPEEVNTFEEEDNVPNPMSEMIANVLGYVPATLLDLAVGLEEHEFEEKYRKYRGRAISTGFADSLAEYIENYMPDWMDDPRIALLISGLMFFGYVTLDAKRTLDAKKKEKEPPKPETITGVYSEGGDMGE